MKAVRLVVTESTMGYTPPKITLGHPVHGESIRDALSAAGFVIGDDVTVVLTSDLAALTGACGPGCQNNGKCWDERKPR